MEEKEKVILTTIFVTEELPLVLNTIANQIHLLGKSSDSLTQENFKEFVKFFEMLSSEVKESRQSNNHCQLLIALKPSIALKPINSGQSI